MAMTFHLVSDLASHPQRRFIKVCRRDYTTPKDCTIWVGDAPYGETGVAFLAADGTGLILMSSDPAGYTAWSKAMEKASKLKGKAKKAAWAAIEWTNGCPDEWGVEAEDACDVSGSSFTLATSASLF